MQKILRVVFGVIVLVFIAIQFFQPDKNISVDSKKHILTAENVPDDMQLLLQNACFDCHSNNTNYLWYHKIAPVSWMVNKHVVEGKKELNFSEWGDMDLSDKIGNLEEICQEVEREKMPIKAYVQMHKNAKLSDEQVAALCDWTEKLGLELLSKLE